MNKLFSNDREDVQKRINAIRMKCVECSCYNSKEADLCRDDLCPLFPYRADGNAVRSEIAALRNVRQNKAIVS